MDSLIDVVDDRDNIIGRATRGDVLAGLGNFRVAHVFVLNDHDELLLTQLGKVRTNDPGRWGSTVAAQLYSGEAYVQAADRRLSEELGLGVPIRFVTKHKILEGRRLKFVGLFEARANEATILEPEHVSGAKFESLTRIQAHMKSRPSTFTDTFRSLFLSYLESRSE